MMLGENTSLYAPLYKILVLRNVRNTDKAKLPAQTFGTCKKIIITKTSPQVRIKKRKSCAPCYAATDMNVVKRRCKGTEFCKALFAIKNEVNFQRKKHWHSAQNNPFLNVSYIVEIVPKNVLSSNFTISY